MLLSLMAAAALAAQPAQQEVRRFTLHCRAAADDRVAECTVADASASDPTASYALALAPYLRKADLGAIGSPGTAVDIRIEMRASSAFGPWEGRAPNGPTHTLYGPDWTERPTPSALMSAYPPAATQRGAWGRAAMVCAVKTDGRLDACRVEEESPPWLGFGKGLLGIAGGFRLRPMSVDGNPVAGALIHIPVRFLPLATGPNLRVILEPTWSEAASFADVAAAYPPDGGGRKGHVVLRCAVVHDGRLEQCDELGPDHAAGFVEAAQNLATKFRLRIDPAVLTGGKVEVELPIALSDPKQASPGDQVVEHPIWLANADPQFTRATLPTGTAGGNIWNGSGAANCVVATDGGLTSCVPGAANPPGLGLSDEVVKLASGWRMSLWSGDGAPVVGARITVPVTFQMKP